MTKRISGLFRRVQEMRQKPSSSNAPSVSIPGESTGEMNKLERIFATATLVIGLSLVGVGLYMHKLPEKRLYSVPIGLIGVFSAASGFGMYGREILENSLKS